ncbi:hypothetical protein DOY81_003927 [Sarcophaga bullata]|nr:hypothetical protein DOY81_003927 [Sarcophaga bullata]
MQTAVDCNGSSSKTTTISTTITATATAIASENDQDIKTMTQQQQPQQQQQQQQHHITHHHLQSQPQQRHEPQHEQPHTLLRSPTAVTEMRNILRQRAISQANSREGGSASSTPPKNGFSHLIDAVEYLGSNVEFMSVTPSPSPQSSPSKSGNSASHNNSQPKGGGGEGNGNKAAATHALHDTYKLNTSSSESSSSSKTSPSNSTSTTSSVIATPILKRNGKIFTDKPVEDNNVVDDTCVAVDGVCKQQQQQQPIRECNNKQLLTNQMLPNDKTSSAATATSTSTPTTITKQELLPLASSSSLNPMSSSTTTSLSIKTPTVAILPSTPSPSPSSSGSSPSSAVSSSSNSTTTTSTTPASATTTPALLSTPTSSSSSSPTSSSSSSSYSSSLASSPTSPTAPQLPSTQAKMKELSITGYVEAELLQWQDMPQYLQFNPYVLKGYRPLQTFKGCLLSLFYWHNETINILTHAIPIVYILAIVPGLMPWDSGYRFLSFCHVFGSVAPWCGSFVYHLFMNIEKGENVYYRLLKLDMVGIWVSQSFGALPLVTATTFCFTFKWKWFIIISYCLLSLWGLYKALTASSPWQRRLCFALPFTMRSILTFFRTIGLVGGNRVALEHVYLQDVVSIFGGAIGAMRIPEKWFPGLVDFYLNSHNIMHVLVVVAVYSMHQATIKDFEWMESTNCDNFTNVTNKVLETTLNANIELKLKQCVNKVKQLKLNLEKKKKKYSRNNGNISFKTLELLKVFLRNIFLLKCLKLLFFIKAQLI